MRTATSLGTVRSLMDLDLEATRERGMPWPALLAELVVGIQLVVTVVDTDLDAAGLGTGVAIATAGTLVAILLTVGDHPAAGGTGRLLAGIAGVATGAGVGAARVSAGVVSAETALAVLALVAGVTLLVSGGVRLVTAIPSWWRLLAVPVAYLVFQFALLPSAFAVLGTHLPRSDANATPPAGARRVTILADGGVSLAAWYTASKNGAAVVLLHGAGGSKASVTAQGAVLARHGYGVLALDASGCGASGGSPMAWGWNGNRDVAAAISFLVGRTEVDPERIGVLGESMGGEQAITAAVADARIRAVVAEGASARTRADVEYLPRDAAGVIQRGYDTIMWGLADLLTDAAPPIPLRDAVHAMTQPLLLITSDDRSDALAGPYLTAGAPPDVVRWDPPNTGHTRALATHPAEWERRVIGFFDVALSR